MMWKIVFTVLAAVVAVGLGGMTGAPQDIDINTEGARDALNFAVVQHNKATNDLYLRQVSRVINVQRQMVAGYKYIITVEMGKTPCRKDSSNDMCPVHQDAEKAQAYECTFTVWTRPWLNEIKLIGQTC